MEEKLREAKTKMLKGELADLTFTDEMKQRVLASSYGKRQKLYFGKKIIPSLISAALVMLFFAGMYEFVIIPNLGGSQHGPTGDVGSEEGVPDGQEQPDPQPDGQEAILPDDTEHEADLPDTNDGLPASEDGGSVETDDIGTVIEEPETDTVQPEPEKPDVMAMTKKFRDEIKSLFHLDRFTPEPEYKAKHAATKEEFFRPLEKMADPKFFDYLLYRFLKETSDGVYLQPQDGPLYFEEDQPYETQKLADTKYQMIQRLDTDMYGPNYTITVTVNYIGGKWIITDIHMDY
ncbi:hypothetical protein [Bacillus sp. B-jedd]|uniref:hypothetical protein n=1 Tax=Bacillus sp. B-jedd TaxID=1476857 RepID=UPI0005156810|nr:hypothetical protein [Bacillus sp. B-jedd]CEG28832.1 hypothetical protein BN1002_03756 [Bacillus sp. B-jedd]